MHEDNPSIASTAISCETTMNTETGRQLMPVQEDINMDTESSLLPTQRVEEDATENGIGGSLDLVSLLTHSHYCVKYITVKGDVD